MSLLIKRVILILVSAFVLFTIVAYLCIPAKLTVQSKAVLNCNAAATGRAINYNWKNIFYNHSDTSFYSGDFAYQIKTPVYNGSNINVSKNGADYNTSLSLIPLAPDTCLLQWNLIITTNINPIQRVVDYFNAKSLKENFKVVAKQLQVYVSKTKNVYGYDIKHTTLTDTVLVFTQSASKNYPDMGEVYGLVDKLRNYISQNKAQETNSPMLHIAKNDSGYMIMVGIPTNIELKPGKEIVSKHLMQMQNKMLTTEVIGGPGTVNNAYKQIEQYMQDHSLSAPVIPYELMITDRNKEKDTTKWITRILYPII